MPWPGARGRSRAELPSFVAVDLDPDRLEAVRHRLGGHLRHLFTGRGAPTVLHRADDDPGLFGPGSVTWRVHADRSMLVGGLRSLLLQTLHPLAMAGVADHSAYRHQPGRRLQRTTAFVMTTTYGGTDAALSAIAGVRRVHERIAGVTPDGIPYRASDPALLAWVHATEVDSFARAYERHGPGPLPPADRDRYVAEMADVADRLGVVGPPRSWPELQGYLEDIRPELRASSQARQGVRFLLVPPMPLAARPAYGIVAAAAVALLPRHARLELRLPLPPLVEPVAVRPATALVLSAVGWALGPPPDVRHLTPSPRAPAAAAGAHAPGGS